jgi:ribose 5-phosphate isomerase
MVASDEQLGQAPGGEPGRAERLDEAALAYVEPGSIVGVGTGSTVNCVIDALATLAGGVAGAVSSSEASIGGCTRSACGC